MSLPLHPPLFPFHLRRGSQRKGPIWLSESGKWQGFHHEVQLLNRLSNYFFNCISLYLFVCAPRISRIPFLSLASLHFPLGEEEKDLRQSGEERRRRDEGDQNQRVVKLPRGGDGKDEEDCAFFFLFLPPSLLPWSNLRKFAREKGRRR